MVIGSLSIEDDNGSSEQLTRLSALEALRMTLHTGLNQYGGEIYTSLTAATAAGVKPDPYWNVLLSLPSLRKLETLGTCITLHDIATRARVASLPSLTSLFIWGSYESTQCKQRDIANAVTIYRPSLHYTTLRNQFC
jgi:hypothetical protein